MKWYKHIKINDNTERIMQLLSKIPINPFPEVKPSLLEVRLEVRLVPRSEELHIYPNKYISRIIIPQTAKSGSIWDYDKSCLFKINNGTYVLHREPLG